jgi:hypothetical protein
MVCLNVQVKEIICFLKGQKNGKILNCFGVTEPIVLVDRLQRILVSGR